MSKTITRKRETILSFFSNERHQRTIRSLTFLMFAFLVAEKLLSGAQAVYAGGRVSFSFEFSIADIISLLIYQSMTILLGIQVQYKYLLIPDFALLGLKLYTAWRAAAALLEAGRHTDLWESSQLEALVESVLFSLFLVVLFAGKLDLRSGSFHDAFPIYCLDLLLVCFIATAIFEVVKIFFAAELHQYPFLIVFNFLKGLLGEAFLDLPYLLLVLMVCFIPHHRDSAEHTA